MLYRWSWNLDVLNFSVEASVVVIGGIVPMQCGQTFFVLWNVPTWTVFINYQGTKKLSIKMVELLHPVTPSKWSIPQIHLGHCFTLVMCTHCVLTCNLMLPQKALLRSITWIGHIGKLKTKQYIVKELVH